MNDFSGYSQVSRETIGVAIDNAVKLEEKCDIIRDRIIKVCADEWRKDHPWRARFRKDWTDGQIVVNQKPMFVGLVTFLRDLVTDEEYRMMKKNDYGYFEHEALVNLHAATQEPTILLDQKLCKYVNIFKSDENMPEDY